MKRQNSIQHIRKKKVTILCVLLLFIGISQFAFFHHVLVEKHGSVHVETKKSSGAHDHCTSSTLANPNIILDYISFTPFIDTHTVSFKSSNESTLIIHRQFNFLRGPPVYSLS